MSWTWEPLDFIQPIPDSENNQKLSHRWHLSEDNSPFVDQIGDADGTNHGTTQVTGSYVDSAARQGDGDGAYVNVGNIDALSGSSLDDFSIAFTVQTTDSDMWLGGAFTGGDQSIQVGVGQVQWSSGGEFSFRIDDSSNDQVQMYTNNFDINDGEKHRCLVSKPNNNANNIVLYVDGQERSKTVSTDQGSGNWTNWSESWYWFARSNDGSPDGYSEAIIDDPCIFNTEITSTEAASYNAPWS